MAELQYEALHENARDHGVPRLGLMSGHTWDHDPKRLGFMLARYKFASKMLAGRSVLEIGCGDGFGTRLLQQTCGRVVGVDFDPVLIGDAQRRKDGRWANVSFNVHNMLDEPFLFNFNGAVALDVLEHIDPKHEGRFLQNLARSLVMTSVTVIGMPSLESQHLASEQSRIGHVNCKSGPDLVATLQQYFRYVLPFSMNDEIVHTGHHAMAHYLLCVCCDVILPR